MKSKFYYSVLIALVGVSFDACKKESPIPNGGLVLGESYKGGRIAYFFVPGDPGYKSTETHGIIAAPSDQSIGIQWYNGSPMVTGAIEKSIGKGNSNTLKIVTLQGAGTYAAKLCYDMVAGTYTDWYLPSCDELNKLYRNRNAIGGFANYYYWSSSEDNANYAWLQDFSTGKQMVNNYKGSPVYVRAIREF